MKFKKKWKTLKRRVRERKREIRLACLLSVFGILSGTILLMQDARNSRLEQNCYLERPAAGEETREEELQVRFDGQQQNITVSVEAQRLKKEEIQKCLQELSLKLEEEMLGENLSPDEVRLPLNLAENLEGTPVSVTWNLPEDGPVNRDGSLNQEDLPEEGEVTELTARLQWEEEILVCGFFVHVYPPVRTEEEQFLCALQEAVDRKGQDTQYERLQELPAEAANRKLLWSRPVDRRGFLVILLGGLGALLVILSGQREEQKREQARRRQMEMDYPEIVSKLKLYMEAGLTCRAAWMKIAGDYQKRRKTELLDQRCAYEEMLKTGYEMQSGVSERQALERFGDRSRVACYKKLVSLLTQNMKKGNRGLGELLELEVWQAFEERKALARKQGEEAGTKMLFPMMGMLAVVMIIVIAPAFLSIRI